MIYDTGTSLIYAPMGIGYEIQARAVGSNTGYYDRTSGIMLTLCSEKENYEDIYLWIDDYRFQIKVDDYFLVFNDILAEED